MGRAGSRITAAAVPGPASGPRPASSTPAIRIISPIIASPLKPHRLAVYCGRDQRENAGARHGVEAHVVMTALVRDLQVAHLLGCGDAACEKEANRNESAPTRHGAPPAGVRRKGQG